MSRIGQVFIPQVPLEENAPSRPQPSAPAPTERDDLGPEVLMLPERMMPGADGVLRLDPGLYLIDTDEAHWHQAWPVLIEQFGKDSLRELNIERGMVLATFALSEPAETSLATPIYAVEPDNASLAAIAHRIGYAGILEPRGVLEWAATTFPEAYQSAVRTAERVADAGSSVGGAVKAAAMVAAVALLARALKK